MPLIIKATTNNTVYTYYNSFTHSYTHACKQTCAKGLLSSWKTDPTYIIIQGIPNISSKGKS